MAGVKRGTEKQIPIDLEYWYENLPKFSVYYLAEDTYGLNRSQVDRMLKNLGIVDG